MSYRTTPNSFVSHLSNREYNFERYGRNAESSRRAARAQMEADDLKIRQASEQRHGRPLSLREETHGVKTPDTRPIREQIKLSGQPTTDPDQSPYAARIVELTTKHRHTTRPTERNKLEHRIAQLTEAEESWRTKRSEERVVEARLASPTFQKEVAHAESTLEKLMLDPSCDQASIADAKTRLSNLQATGDVNAYRDAFNRAEAISLDILRNRKTELEAAALKASQEIGLGEATNRLI